MDNFGYRIVFAMFAPFLLSPLYHFVPENTSLLMRTFYIALLFAAYPLTQFFGAPLLGDFADRAGRKKALYITIFGVIIGFVISGIACFFTNLSLLVFSRFFTGFFAGNLGICLSAIADLSPSEKIRSRNFGIVTVVWGFTWNLAILAGGHLSDPTKSPYFSPSLPFWITAFVTLLSLVALARYYFETHETKVRHPFNLIKGIHNIQHVLKIKKIRPYFLILLLWTLGWGMTIQWFGTFSILKYGATQEAISWGLLIQGGFWMLGGSVFNPLLLRKYNSRQIATMSFFCAMLILFTLFFYKTYFLFCFIYSTAAIFSSLAFSNTMNLVSIHAPEDLQGKIMGLSQSMMAMGFVIRSISGAFISNINPIWFFPIAGTYLLVNFLILFFQKEKSPKLAKYHEK